MDPPGNQITRCSSSQYPHFVDFVDSLQLVEVTEPSVVYFDYILGTATTASESVDKLVDFDETVGKAEAEAEAEAFDIVVHFDMVRGEVVEDTVVVVWIEQLFVVVDYSNPDDQQSDGTAPRLVDLGFPRLDDPCLNCTVSLLEICMGMSYQF